MLKCSEKEGQSSVFQSVATNEFVYPRFSARPEKMWSFAMVQLHNVYMSKCKHQLFITIPLITFVDLVSTMDRSLHTCADFLWAFVYVFFSFLDSNSSCQAHEDEGFIPKSLIDCLKRYVYLFMLIVIRYFKKY